MFALFLGILWSALAAQAFAASRTGFLTHKQMLVCHNLGENQGYSFFDHGGMWADLGVSVLVASMMGKYQFKYFSIDSFFVALVACAIWVGLTVGVYVPAGKRMPEAHAHNGTLPIAGWIHIVFASFTMWIIAMVYITGFTHPVVSTGDIFATSGVLSVWAYLGVRKFNNNWRFDFSLQLQVAGLIVLLWGLAFWRLWG